MSEPTTVQSLLYVTRSADGVEQRLQGTQAAALLDRATRATAPS